LEFFPPLRPPGASGSRTSCQALPELEQKRAVILRELASLGPEKQKLSRWLLGSELTHQAARFVNAQIDELCEQETRLQEQQWALEDQLSELQKECYNAEAIAGQLQDFVQNFPQLQVGERKLLVDARIGRAEIGKNKRVILTMRSPFAFTSLSPILAPRGEKPKVAEMMIWLAYDLSSYYENYLPNETIAYTKLSRHRYSL
jgi:hypothetical protein